MIISNRVYFWDGDNFVIVTKKCSRQTAKKIMEALASVDLAIDEAEPSTAVPVPEPEEAMPRIPQEMEAITAPPESEPEESVRSTFTDGKFAGMTPTEVLEKYRDKAFPILVALKKDCTDTQFAKEIGSALSVFFVNRFRNWKQPYEEAATLTEKQAANFYKYFGSVVSEKKKQTAVQLSGCVDFDAFLKDGSLEAKQSLIASVIEQYVLKPNKKK